MEEKKISVIIPIYNCEKYIDKCIKSIINQKYSNLEIILINDGSTDNSYEICEKYKKKDKRIVLINKKNEGVSIARNIGLEYATGEYISFIDADDWIDENLYYEVLSNNDGKFFDIYKFPYVNELKKSYVTNIFDKNLEIKKEDYDNMIYPLIAKTYSFSNAATTIFKKDILKDIRFKEDVGYGEDFLFCTRAILLANNIKYVNVPYYHYRINSNSSSQKLEKNKIIKNMNDSFYVYGEIYIILSQCNVNEEILVNAKKRISKEIKICAKRLTLVMTCNEFRKQINTFNVKGYEIKFKNIFLFYYYNFFIGKIKANVKKFFLRRKEKNEKRKNE